MRFPHLLGQSHLAGSHGRTRTRRLDTDEPLAAGHRAVIAALEAACAEVEGRLEAAIAADPALARKREILVSMPGISEGGDLPRASTGATCPAEPMAEPFVKSDSPSRILDQYPTGAKREDRVYFPH